VRALLRKALRYKRDSWRETNCIILNSAHPSPYVIRMMRSKRVTWAGEGEICRMHRRAEYRIFVGNLKE
jgi:hypothetical protein